jgi:hypothetical protein
MLSLEDGLAEEEVLVHMAAREVSEREDLVVDHHLPTALQVSVVTAEVVTAEVATMVDRYDKEHE